MQVRSFANRCRRVAGPVARRAVTLSVALASIAVATQAYAATDIVLYSSDVTTVNGNWAKASDGSAAGGATMQSADNGWSATNAPLASPNDYFEATFTAPAYVKYHVWLRLRATGDSKYNDSVWVQFSDALDSNGSSIDAIGSTNALLVNLENCSGCGVSGWGWQDKAYWLTQANVVQFPSSGTHTIRVQTREDGVMVDQLVLSPSTYISSAPGSVENDSTIVPKPQTASVASTSSSLAYSGSPAAVPGQVNGENFDTGGEGTSYHDTTAGNAGGAYRNTNVDIESSSEGGYDIGWIAPGEWLNYTVNVSSGGSYTVQLRVSSPNGATMHVGFNTASNVWQSVTVPATGGWQNWTTVSVPVTLGAGTQQMTVLFDTGGMNYRYANVTSSSTASASSTGSSSGSSSGLSPYNGSPAAVPGTIQAEDFDNGGEGVAYHDTTAGNAGGAYRNTNVDIESSSEGGYDIGWTAAGEWLNYTVNVASAGAYTVQLRVASMNGGSMHVGFNSASSVWSSVSIPSTGGWQNWTTVSVPVTLGAGTQQMTLMLDTGGVNLNYVTIVSGSSSSTSGGGGSSSGSGSSSGTTLNVAEWNVQVDDSSASHAQTVMDYLAGFSPQPQVIVIEEAHLSQFNTYLSELRNRTGGNWQGVMQTHCPLGYWNGSTCTGSEDEGVAVFTTLPIQNSSKLWLPYPDAYHSARAAVRVAVSINGETMQIWGTHLQVGNATSRNQSMALIKQWSTNYAAPQILSGDMNADMDQIDTTSGYYPTFVDTWQVVGSGSGYTCSTPSPTMKLDYWLTDASQKAQPQWTQVNTSTGTVSDHYPVQTTFIVR